MKKRDLSTKISDLTRLVAINYQCARRWNERIRALERRVEQLSLANITLQGIRRGADAQSLPPDPVGAQGEEGTQDDAGEHVARIACQCPYCLRHFTQEVTP